ncbi:MAG: hypothetical protein R6X13_02300 [bacterium]
MTPKRTLILLFVLAALAAAAPSDLTGDNDWNEKDAFIAATQALETTSRTLNRWALITAGLIAAVALVSIWRVFAYGRKLGELDLLRSTTEKRFGEFSDEILRAKRKVTEADQNVQRMEAEVAQVRGLVGDHRAGDTADIERQLLELRAEVSRVTEQGSGLLAALARAEESVALARRSADEAGAAVAGVNELLDGFGERLGALETRPAPQPVPAEPPALEEPVPVPEPEPEPGPEPEPTRLEPDFAGLHEAARARLAEGDFDAALAEASRLRDAAGGDSHRAAAAEIVIGAAQLWLGDLDRSVMALERAVELDGDARQAIARDDVIARWLASGHREAAKFCREVNKSIAPIRMKPPTAKVAAPAAKAKKPVPKRGRR